MTNPFKSIINKLLILSSVMTSLSTSRLTETTMFISLVTTFLTPKILTLAIVRVMASTISLLMRMSFIMMRNPTLTSSTILTTLHASKRLNLMRRLRRLPRPPSPLMALVRRIRKPTRSRRSRRLTRKLIKSPLSVRPRMKNLIPSMK